MTPSLGVAHHSGDSDDTTFDVLMGTWQESLLRPGETDPCESALGELAEYFDIDRAEARHRCENWEQHSINEWEKGDRGTSDGLLEFYRTTQSWIFDTVWYHAKQCEGQPFPESVAIAHGLRHLQSGLALDFGAGPGSTSLFFHRLGWRGAMADISTTMQAFARWRFEQRGIPATFYDTSVEELPVGTFDLITAIDVVAHIPDWPRELVRLHRALKVDGLLVFNIDARPKAPENAWHLYQSHYPLIRPMRRAGFARRPMIEFFYVYQKIQTQSAGRRIIETVVDVLRYNRAASFAGHAMRSAKWRS